MIINEYISQILKEVGIQQEEYILNQLNELVSRDLIVIQQTEKILTTQFDMTNDKYLIKVSQGIRLVPKEFEYIQKLEKENSGLKLQLENIKNSVMGIYND